MLAASPMLGTHPHFEAVWTCSIAVTAAWTAGAVVVNPEADPAQRTGAFDHITDSRLRLTA